MPTAMEMLAEVSEFPTAPDQENGGHDTRRSRPAWAALDLAFSMPALLAVGWAALKLR